MFIQAVHIYIKPDKIDEFKEKIQANHEGSMNEPGCVRFDVAQSRDDPTEFFIWECYIDEDAAASHKITPHYLAFKEVAPELQSRDRCSDFYDGVYVNSDKAE